MRRGILLTLASVLASLSTLASASVLASTPTLKFSVKVFVQFIAPPLERLYILQYVRSHILASIELDVSVMHD